MSLPTDIKLPDVPDDLEKGPVTDYLNELVFELQNSYERTTYNVNGSFRNSGEVDGTEWIPTISGSTTAGTSTYTKQVGWSLRQGIMTEIWFDIEWGAIGGRAGTLRLELPYKVISNPPATGGFPGQPFVGAAYTSQLNYMTAGQTAATVTPIPGTYFAHIVCYGTGAINASGILMQANGRVAVSPALSVTSK